LSGDFWRRQPSLAAKVLRITGNSVSLANVPDDQTCERVLPARAEITPVESLGNLSVRFFGRQRPNEFNDLGGSTNEIRRTQRQRSFYRRRCASPPANVDLDFLILHERHIFDKESQHPLPIARRSAWIIPHMRKIGG